MVYSGLKSILGVAQFKRRESKPWRAVKTCVGSLSSPAKPKSNLHGYTRPCGVFCGKPEKNTHAD